MKVESTVMKIIDYSQEEKKLKVDFHDGSVWAYHDVPKETWDKILTIDKEGGSVGGFFNKYVRPKFKGNRLA